MNTVLAFHKEVQEDEWMSIINGTVSRRRGAGVSLLTDCSIGFPHVLYPTSTRFWGSHKFVLCSRGSQHSGVC
jgi:hypothetical protein